MKKRTQIRNSKIGQSGMNLVILILVFIVVGCAPAATQPVDQSIPTPLIEATQVIEQATPTPI
ncbi:MAG TPA: hypothetical protein VFQ23_18550, partial [Anaerolineales bacterium]|nr:hypothetical protein [Anaerolineales bacterium]